MASGTVKAVPTDGEVIHKAGSETMTGEKIFASSCRIKNNTVDPRIVFSGSNNSIGNASLYAADAGISGGNEGYGNVQFQFYEYSPGSDGTSRTSKYERYDLPAVDTARSSNKVYEIITSKGGTYKPLYYKEVTATTTSNGNINLGIPHASYAVLTALVTTPSDNCAMPIRYNGTNWGVHIMSNLAAQTPLASTSATVKVWYIPIADIPTL